MHCNPPLLSIILTTLCLPRQDVRDLLLPASYYQRDDLQASLPQHRASASSSSSRQQHCPPRTTSPPPPYPLRNLSASSTFMYADKLGLAPEIFMNTQPSSDTINMDLASCLATPPEFQEPESRLLRFSSALSIEKRNSRESVR
jgi:hypothetical protein